MIKLPNIDEQKCPTLLSLQCPDGSTPETGLPFLLIKPALALVCSTDGTIQFSTFLAGPSGEVLLSSGVAYSSSNSAAVAINASTGLATILGAGVVTIFASWQDKYAHAQITVLGGEDCCEDIHVGTLLVIDRSLSMSLPFGNSYASLLDAAKAIALADIAALLVGKDTMGVEQFSSTPQLDLDLTDDVVALQAAVQAITIDPSPDIGGDTNISDALDLAISTVNACSTCDRKVIVLFSDGRNRPVLGSAEYDAMIAAANAFKSGGGIIVCVGIRAAGDGYVLLQQLASGGFFVNAVSQIVDASAALLCMLGYYCAGTRPLSGFGYTCEGYNCCDAPPGEQPQDPTPLLDIESGEVGAFQSTKEECASCPPGMLYGLIPKMTSNTEPSGEASVPIAPISSAYKGVDGNNFTFSLSPQLQYQFDQPVSVSRYSVYFTFSGALLPVIDGVLEGSNNGSSWTTVHSQADISNYAILSFPVQTFEYWRITLTPPLGVQIAIIEFQLFGDPIPVCRTATAESSISQADADAKASAAALALAQGALQCQ